MHTAFLGSLLKLPFSGGRWVSLSADFWVPWFVERNGETEPQSATKKQNHASLWEEASAAGFGRSVGKLAMVAHTCNPSKQEAEEARWQV